MHFKVSKKLKFGAVMSEECDDPDLAEDLAKDICLFAEAFNNTVDNPARNDYESTPTSRKKQRLSNTTPGLVDVFNVKHFSRQPAFLPHMNFECISTSFTEPRHDKNVSLPRQISANCATIQRSSASVDSTPTSPPTQGNQLSVVLKLELVTLTDHKLLLC